VTLGAEQHACQVHFEATESFIHRAMNQYMNSDTVTEVPEGIAPAATRGKQLRTGGKRIDEHQNERLQSLESVPRGGCFRLL
jgi:hypothetical protein